MTATVLVVEDEPAIQELIAYNLKQAGHQPLRADNAEQALNLVSNALPVLVLLDWMLPGMSGIDLARRLRNDRRTKSVPIIMLTARSEEQDKLHGLDTGADDYITKPFSQRLLIERIRALLRRQDLLKQKEDEGSKAKAEKVVRGNLELDDARHLCTWKGQPVNLTVTEYLLVKALAQRPGHVKNRDQLIDMAYGENIYVDDRTIDSHIKRVRKKFKQVDDDFNHIETLYGIGYRYKE